MRYNLKMNISARWLTAALAATAVLLISLHLVFYVLADGSTQGWLFNLAGRFNVDQETSLPTWFSQMLLLLAAGIAFFIARGEGLHRLRKYWYMVAVIMVLLSVDEGASFHETLGVWLGQHLGWQVSLGFAVLRDWVLLALIAAVVVGLLLWRFVVLLPARTRLLFALAAALFIGGALIVETLHFTTFQIEYGSFSQAVSNAVEEGFEMFGVITLIYALASYAARYIKPQKVKFN